MGWLTNSPTNQAATPAANYSVTGPIDLDVEVADLLAQGVAVEAQKVGGANLIAAGRSQGRREQRDLDLLEDAVIEARRRHAIGEAREVRGQIGLDRTTEIVDALLHGAA